MKIDVRDGLLGLCVGDALGVPVEFQSRERLRANPVTGVRGHGTYNQPPGTWSDDSSLAFCLAESLCGGYDLRDVARRFVEWLFEAKWTPHGKVFDVGGTTRDAIFRLAAGHDPATAGGNEEWSNGNGSLMRILPLAYLPADGSDPFDRVAEVSGLTHAHPRCAIACALYARIASALLAGATPSEACALAAEWTRGRCSDAPYAEELPRFSRVLSGEIPALPEDRIESDGYVIHTLEAALWCLLRSSSYRETVLAAINLGGDTDTTAAVAGGLAGIVYGWKSIPEEWIDSLARRDDIFALLDRFQSVVA